MTAFIAGMILGYSLGLLNGIFLFPPSSKRRRRPKSGPQPDGGFLTYLGEPKPTPEQIKAAMDAHRRKTSGMNFKKPL